MKKNFAIIILTLIATPVIASCKIDDGSACIANVRTSPDAVQTIRTSGPSGFSADIKTTRPADKKLTQKGTRAFRPNPTDYGYNTNCQFGICTDSGMPKVFNSPDR
ncbi:MAG: hypothetical protein MJ237_02050 [bacterium]|nr:hypothetical protein [bacterium]